MNSFPRIFFIPVVSNQNNGESVKFTLTASGGNTLVFENASHDFPQKIFYKKIPEDSSVAEILGIMEGQYAPSNFP